MSGPVILVGGFVASLMIAYLVAKFSPNLWVVMIAILVLQTLGYLWGLNAGVFFGQSILEIVSILSVTFIWFMIAAQMHLWVNGRSIERPAKEQVSGE